ncbi:O-acetylhomoserine aminocarboxypropyltransferase/cysteine synthase family protein [Desulfoluna spongiiphila]|uniref:O-acetylhomoserine (Thiol)-lyase n=1 Tax=Desulfoluna spongiiphila TaxID=419481 RepID=A0A1G5HIW1_9BACT|nr:aminotransferase class I/II-fold pyridoxal phosphate-dependent enzyme [Desulfoluna spongiiphila]SCY63657.1 O-acetylhomoserine (thiol)-lyase [Desulfoluna spongiiphila]
MTDISKRKFATRVIHSGQETHAWEGATLPPVYQSASHRHPTAESLSDAFSGKGGHIYGRLSNPTNDALETKLSDLEQGQGALVMASGMAAVSNTCMALLRAGDEFVAGRSLFMSTWLLFTRILKKYNITARLADPTDLGAMEAAITEKTRFLYIESIGNPAMDVPDIEKTAALAHAYGLPLVVDNTLGTPFLVRPLELGADAVVHSTTKYISGHGNATGGVVVDGGTFDWGTEKFADFAPFVEKRGNLALLDRIWREHHINHGTTQAPMNSYLTMVGLDTLALRMERHLDNALAVARFLETHPKVAWVNFPGLHGHPNRDVAEKQFGGKGFGAMLTFGLENETACRKTIDNLSLIYHLANIGDCKSLMIHPWSTQYVSFEPDEKAALGIRPDMLRLSVGIEAVEDIIADLDQAIGASRE